VEEKRAQSCSADLPERFVAMLTAGAHRFGKPLVGHLAEAGADLAITSLALLASRIRIAELHGVRAIALRMNANDPLSVRFTLNAITFQLGRLDLLVHVAPHELVATSHGLDPCTEAVAASMQDHGGSIVYLLDRNDPFPEASAAEWAKRRVFLVGVRVTDHDAAREVGEAVISAFRRSPHLAGSIHAVGELTAL
jgi:NAD(P)-dependent dehydrogenase (short-subunit alcohol dehydrogenase family)